MQITKIEEHIHLIDLKPNGIENFVASYVLLGENAAIVESGPALTAQKLLLSLKKLGVKPEDVTYVAVSHIHLDHGGGVGILLKHLPKASLIVHQRGGIHTANPQSLWTASKKALGRLAQMYGKPEPVAQERIIVGTDGMVLDIGNNVKLRVVETLGHASHHLTYYETLSQGIFTGDAAGIYLNKHNVVVPTSPAPFHLDIALASLRKLINLKSKFLYYSHFGKAENSVEKLQAYGEQLKLWAKIAARGIEKGENLEAIRKKIIETDSALQKTGEFIRSHPILNKTVLLQSIEGIVRYVEKTGYSDHLA
ncbi:MAG: MBL fold metallo-hydrolase [Candidatus Bathyarchaeota archaeon]|nr:MAG: MBL fold metallo-hydrolase [Candidatus Bathyarchaeota archaeon]